MKTKDIIIVILCAATAIVCIALTFWGNLKNDGVLTTDAYLGVIATLIGVCATIVVGFQIASFVKMHETEKQIKEVKAERDKMQAEKDKLYSEINFIENELSNVFVLLSQTIRDANASIFTLMLSIVCMNVTQQPEIVLRRYRDLYDKLSDGSNKNNLYKISRFVNKLKNVNIPQNIEHYSEIMKLHFEIIEILENAAKEQQ